MFDKKYKMRKIKNCKSIRRKDVILHLYNTTNLSSSEIGEQVGLKSPTVRKVGIENNISLKRLNRRKTYQTDRNEKLIEDIRKGKLSYKEIGKKYNITKQRISQFARDNNISRWEESRKTIKNIKEDIKEDIIKGVPYKTICEKYRYKKYSKSVLSDMKLFTYFIEKRNKEIINLYKEMTAKDTITIPVNVLDDPYRITRLGTVYDISSKSGYKKYPMIGDRCKGGVFEPKKVINLIKKLRSKNYGYRKIALELNKKGWKTPTGKLYSPMNVSNKHKGILKYKL